MINNLKDRFYIRNAVQIAKNIEQILLVGIQGKYNGYEELFEELGFKTYEQVIDKELLLVKL